MNKVKLCLLMLLPVWLLLASGASYGRHATVLIDAESGKILHEQQAHQAWYPASLTKVMTLYMTFDALRAGRIDLYDEMPVSGHAAAQPQSKLGLRRGEYISVEDAILALITRSANDAAVVLAEYLGGTESSFAVKMTSKAHAIGMHNTHFMNATGLPHTWQVTTARDMALMAWRTQHNFPEYYHYFGAHEFYFRGREMRAINRFTAHYPGAEGMKTGFTCGSGYNLIGAAHQNGRRLIGVVLGGMSSSERYDLMMDMMDAGFADQYEGGLMPAVTTIRTGSPGSPPYQLDCGNRNHNATVQAHDSDHGDDAPATLKTRYYRPPVTKPAVRHVEIIKPAPVISKAPILPHPVIKNYHRLEPKPMVAKVVPTPVKSVPNLRIAEHKIEHKAAMAKAKPAPVAAKASSAKEKAPAAPVKLVAKVADKKPEKPAKLMAKADKKVTADKKATAVVQAKAVSKPDAKAKPKAAEKTVKVASEKVIAKPGKKAKG